MLQIRNKHININRGDAATIKISANVSFNENDTIRLRVTAWGDLNDIKLTKSTTVVDPSTIATITLTPSDTRGFTEAINQPQHFWYEIDLNNETVIVGYDSTGPKEFTVYPEAGGVG